MADDMMETLKGLLGDNAEEKIRTVMSALGKNTSEEEKTEDVRENTENKVQKEPEVQHPSVNAEALQYVAQLRKMADSFSRADDARSRLLMSLKPYMRVSRQHSIDNAVRLLNISRISGLFNL